MFDFGDLELTIETSRIPFLIWIQLIVFLLLLLLLFFCLSVVASDHLSLDSPTATASESATGIHRSQRSLINHHSTPTPIINCLQNTRGGESISIKGEIATRGSAEIVREEIAGGEASPLYFLHPCYYFRLARVAFLKCLGLDSTTESDGPATSQKHRKSKES